MDLGFGGPVWHASVRPYDGESFALAQALAHRALEGVGDASLGQWEERGDTAFHVRRRLSAVEAEKHGLTMRDIRGTDEAKARAEAVVKVMPRLKAFAAQEIRA